MDQWRLLPRPERVTELYFTDHRQLQDRTSFDAPQIVEFTVNNLEHQATTYTYTLSVVSEDSPEERQLSRDSFSLAHDRSKSIANSVDLPPHKRAVIKVDLEYKSIANGDDTASAQRQSIHYWTTDSEKVSERDGNQ